MALFSVKRRVSYHFRFLMDFGFKKFSNQEVETLGWTRRGIVFIRKGFLLIISDGVLDERITILKTRIDNGKVNLENIESLEEYLMENGLLTESEGSELFRYTSSREFSETLKKSAYYLKSYVEGWFSLSGD